MVWPSCLCVYKYNFSSRHEMAVSSFQLQLQLQLVAANLSYFQNEKLLGTQCVYICKIQYY